MNIFAERILILIGGVCLDLLIGDPHRLWHPVQGIGWLITKMEHVLRGKLPDQIAGGFLAVIVAAVSTAVPALLLALAGVVSPWLKRILAVIMCWQLLAMKSLKTESMKVYKALKQGDIDGPDGARHAVSMIVGRDTSVLDETGITKAAIETVAENSSDGVVAPLLFLVCFGIPGGFFYKSVNTMDSMIGYRNEKYLHFGTAAARMDDVVNYLPSRIAALAMILAAFLLPGFDGRNAFRIWKRDRRKHASPNSAQTESACAGALHIQLAGDAVYFGKKVKKPTLGDPDRPVETEDIRRANRLLYCMSFLVLAAGISLLGICGKIL